MAVVVTNLSPAFIAQYSQVVITLTGTEFDKVTEARLSVAPADPTTGTVVPFTIISPTSMTITSLAVPGPANQSLRLTAPTAVGGGTIANSLITVMAPPTITSVVPGGGIGGTTTVTINGANLSAATATFGGIAAARVNGMPDFLQVIAPAGIYGPQPIVVTTQWGSATAMFAYPPAAPVLSSVTPSSGIAGNSLTILGSNLLNATVTVGGRPVQPTFPPTFGGINITAPAGLWGPQPIVATTPGGVSAPIIFGYPPPPPPVPTYGRAARLTLPDGRAIALDDVDSGYAMTELDLGYPAPREVVSNKPDQDGVDDRTVYFGSRVVTAKITSWQGGSMLIDDIARAFAPFMDIRQRPTLHYTEDSLKAERYIRLRPSDWAAPMGIPPSRDLQLSFVASDPVMWDPTVHTATAWSGSSTSGGRTYPLTFNRIYPPGGGSPVNGVIQTAGDVPARPVLRIYGPITNPMVVMENITPGSGVLGPWLNMFFINSFTIAAGHFVEVDYMRKTILIDADPKQPAYQNVDWNQSSWGAIPVAPSTTYLSLMGSTTTSISQVVATWQDGFLT